MIPQSTSSAAGTRSNRLGIGRAWRLRDGGGSSSGVACRYRRNGHVPLLYSPRWIVFHLVVIAAVVAMINLGFWQLRRLEERRRVQRHDRSPLRRSPRRARLAAGRSAGDLDAIEWRPVTFTGQFVAEGDVRIVNRSQNGQAGDNIVSPFRLDDGRIVVVNRGFVPLGVEEVAPEPAGEVTVVGRASTLPMCAVGVSCPIVSRVCSPRPNGSTSTGSLRSCPRVTSCPATSTCSSRR